MQACLSSSHFGLNDSSVALVRITVGGQVSTLSISRASMTLG